MIRLVFLGIYEYDFSNTVMKTLWKIDYIFNEELKDSDLV